MRQAGGIGQQRRCGLYTRLSPEITNPLWPSGKAFHSYESHRSVHMERPLVRLGQEEHFVLHVLGSRGRV